MKACDVTRVMQQAVDWFIPAAQREEEFVLRRARIVVAFSFILAVWGPPLAIIWCFVPGGGWSTLGSILATFVIAHVPFTLRYTRSLTLAGNCLILNVFLIISYLSYLTGGQGAPPLAWNVALPMFAVAIVGYRYGLLWTAVTLFTYAGFYVYGQLGYHVPRQLTDDQLKLLNFTVLCGLLLLVLSLTLLFESNQNRSLQLLRMSNDKLAETSAHLQAIIDNAPDGILTVDAAGIIRSVNPAAEKLFEYKEAEMIGKPVKMLMPLPSAEPQGNKGAVNNLSEEFGGSTCTGRRKSGRLFPLHVAVGLTCFSSKRLLTCILRDVTDQAIAEEYQQQFIDLMERSRAFIGLAGLDRKMSFLNLAGRRLVGMKPNARVSETSLQDYCTDRTWAAMAEAAIPAAMKGAIWEGEGQFQHYFSVSPIDVHLSVFSLRNPRGPEMLCIEAVPTKRAVGESTTLQNLMEPTVANLEGAG